MGTVKQSMGVIGAFASANGGSGLFEGILFNNTNNPSLGFQYSSSTGNGVFYLDGGGNTTIARYFGNIEDTKLIDRSNLYRPLMDVKKFSSNDGFTRIPRYLAKSRIYDTLGKYSDYVWDTYTDGNGKLYISSPFSNGSTRVRMTFEIKTYKAVIDVPY